MRWIFRYRQIWDFFYEHCSLFTKDSLTKAFQTCGFAVDNVRHVFSGQYLWITSHVADFPFGASVGYGDLSDWRRLDGDVTFQAARYAKVEAALLAWWRNFLQRRSKVALWGAGAKGVTLANLVDPEAELIDCVVDVNPAKQGGFVPGTGHSIIAPELLTDRGVTTIVLMNPNYSAEVARQMAALQVHADLVSEREVCSSMPSLWFGNRRVFIE